MIFKIEATIGKAKKKKNRLELQQNTIFSKAELNRLRQIINVINYEQIENLRNKLK